MGICRILPLAVIAPEDGVGFVTVRSVSRAVCDFGERELSDGNIFDWPLE